VKAIQYYSNDDVRVVELPRPSAGLGELLVRVAACGVCASDVMEWYMRPRAPLFIGHEPVGTVAEVGAGVAGFTPGDRVFVHHHVPCLECRHCRRGHQTLCATFKRTRLDPAGMAEYIRVPAEQVALDVLKLPDSMSFADATLIEPVGCCVRALDRAEIAPGDSVMIVAAGARGGCLWPIGSRRAWSWRAPLAPMPRSTWMEATPALPCARLTMAGWPTW
jgi:L-iditol 2-dehydrogenase